jgi:hypothetical protein
MRQMAEHGFWCLGFGEGSLTSLDMWATKNRKTKLDGVLALRLPWA